MGACVLEKEQYLYSHAGLCARRNSTWTVMGACVLEKEQYLYSHGGLCAREGTVPV